MASVATRVGVPEVGERIGDRYELVRQLGSGAAGVVFEAAHVHIGKRVALKWLYPHLAVEEVAAKRFFLEARAACLIEHPNVIEVYDAGKDRDSLFLAMELLEGEPLSARIERGIHRPEDLVALLLPALQGVAAAHDAGIIHRDLKPENIFLARPRGGRAGGPKVLDFGISKLTENRERLTSAGAFVGSPYYMAPEQIQDASAVDARVDIYALGVILFEGLSRTLPFEANTLTDLFFRVTRETAPSLVDAVPDIDPQFAEVVQRAMATDPRQRIPDARALAHALAPWAPSAPKVTREDRDTDVSPTAPSHAPDLGAEATVATHALPARAVRDSNPRLDDTPKAVPELAKTVITDRIPEHRPHPEPRACNAGTAATPSLQQGPAGSGPPPRATAQAASVGTEPVPNLPTRRSGPEPTARVISQRVSSQPGPPIVAIALTIALLFGAAAVGFVVALALR